MLLYHYIILLFLDMSISISKNIYDTFVTKNIFQNTWRSNWGLLNRN